MSIRILSSIAMVNKMSGWMQPKDMTQLELLVSGKRRSQSDAIRLRENRPRLVYRCALNLYLQKSLICLTPVFAWIKNEKQNLSCLARPAHRL